MPRPGADDAAPVEYLYVPCARIRRHGCLAEPRRWVQEVPIVRKTAKLIYYTSDSWDRREAVVSPGCISREQFEADRHGYPAGVIPVPADRHRPGPAGPVPPSVPRGPERRLVPAARLDELLGRAAAVGVSVGHGAA